MPALHDLAPLPFFSVSSGDTEEEMAAAALSRRQATQVSLTINTGLAKRMDLSSDTTEDKLLRCSTIY